VLFIIGQTTRLRRRCQQQHRARSSLSNPQADTWPRAARNEIKCYPIGHFDIYVGEAWERAVADQTEFLVRTLKP